VASRLQGKDRESSNNAYLAHKKIPPKAATFWGDFFIV
jgi:hypothetical protein